ncbi:MAG: hypothetical protein E4H01_15080 [Lysobacterales bacterium]|nr:MAG: hypothetical protein E4H01_15080 [Xanthomonadales bacterium]
MKYNHEWIARKRAEGLSWDVLANGYGTTSNNLRSAHYRWLKNANAACGDDSDRRYVWPDTGLAGMLGEHEADNADVPAAGKILDWPDNPEVDSPGEEPADYVQRTLTKDEISRIHTLDDLLDFFEVDRSLWEVRDYRVNKWEQASKGKDGDVRITPLYQVRANLIRSRERDEAVLQQVWADFIVDAIKWAPPAAPAILQPLAALDEGVLYEVAINDPHIGMLAWGKEVGRPYDIEIADRDYRAAANTLLRWARVYNTERILFVVGNDLLHVDHSGMNTKGGTTTAGTPQDVDTRLAKMFTIARRAVVAAVDEARGIAPVDVMVVPGNHDKEQMYRLGEVLHAWYRNDDQVNVIYSANKRKFYRWFDNGWMFTHGEEYKRKMRNLPLIFATDDDGREAWGAKHREIHSGHLHAGMQGRYVPEMDQTEERAIITRALPGLTGTDAWHHEQGYLHNRRATGLVYRKSGGLVSLHEFHPED